MSSSFSLGDLADPKQYHESIAIDGFDRSSLLFFLRSILNIRLAEYKLAENRKNQTIGGPVHLSVGQEAIAVGISQHLSPEDFVFGAHRSHSHLLALNPDFYKLFCEVLGRNDGFSKGMGGSMHLWDGPSGFMGSVPIVAGTVPLATGAALRAKLSKLKSVAVAYLGDGAVEEVVVQESLNLASVHKLPIIFVVENNLFASHMHTSLRQPVDGCYRFAISNKIEYDVVDGNDVCQMSNVSRKAVALCKNGQGPYFIEAVTFRWFGHVDWREDIDVGVNRSQEDIIDWRLRDPLKRLAESLVSTGMVDDSYIKKVSSEIQNNINASWEKALDADYPSSDKLLNRVYAD